MAKTIQVKLNQVYQTKVAGLGEIYEMISINRKRHILRKKFNQGKLFLCSNKDHSGRGDTLSALKRKISKQFPKRKILAAGLVDCPPWPSSPLEVPRPKGVIYNDLTVFLAKIVFSILAYLEFIWATPRKAHMIYVLINYG